MFFRVIVLVGFLCFEFVEIRGDVPPSSAPGVGYISNKNVAEIPEVKEFFSSLHSLLQNSLLRFGKMPETNEEQHRFAQVEIDRFQAWTDLHFEDLIDMRQYLPMPDPAYLRYGRNLVLVNAEKGIYVFLHILNPHCCTPKHWHSQKGLSSLAFATVLGEGGKETKWEMESCRVDPNTLEHFVRLENEYYPKLVVGKLASIPGDYGAHQISNVSDQPLMLFEIYFEPEKMSSIDVPIAVINSQSDHIIDTVSVSWLNEHNLAITAARENWPQIEKNEALALFSSSMDAKIFTLVKGETVYVPRALVPSKFEAATSILQDSDHRFLVRD